MGPCMILAERYRGVLAKPCSWLAEFERSPGGPGNDVSHYYYTVAALPAIHLGDKVPISEEAFCRFAEDTVRPDDYRVLCKSRWGSLDPTGSPFADRILSWDKELRLELAKARLAVLQFSSSQSLPESDGFDVLLEEVKTALAMDSPRGGNLFKRSRNYAEEINLAHFLTRRFNFII